MLKEIYEAKIAYASGQKDFTIEEDA